MDCTCLVKNMGLLSTILSFVATEQHDLSVLFFEFEEVLAVGTGFLLILMYLFYVKYPYNKEN
jgi:hypothetical protein